MFMTSALANKILKKLDEEKSYLESKENSGCLYTAAEKEKPLVPDYSFRETEKKLLEINRKIQKIKHAVNVSNVTAQLQVGSETLSVDTVLVRMAQANRRIRTLDSMRKHEKKERRSTSFYDRKQAGVEYTYVNYNLEDVEAEYQRLTKEVMDLQLALDLHNQTETFEVDIEL